MKYSAQIGGWVAISSVFNMNYAKGL